MSEYLENDKIKELEKEIEKGLPIESEIRI